MDAAGNDLIVSVTDHPESEDDTDRIFSVDVADGKMSLLFAPNRSLRRYSRFSPDGKQFAYAAARVDGPEPHDIYVRPIDRFTLRSEP